MKIWLRLFALISVCVLIVLAVGSILPRNYHLLAEIEIEAPATVVFPLINELPNWQGWSNFSEQRIESLRITYGTKRAGVGASQTWQDARGSGKLWITNSESNELIEYKLNFDQFPTMDSQIRLTANGEKTSLKWTSDGSLPAGPFYGYGGFLFNRQMQYEYETSLERLKKIAEGGLDENSQPASQTE